MTTQFKECIEGHYEVEEVPYGKVYKWVPVKGQEGKPLVEDETYFPEHRAYEEWRAEIGRIVGPLESLRKRGRLGYRVKDQAGFRPGQFSRL